MFIDGVIPENVEDIILEQEKRAKSTKTEGGKSMAWLVGYLSGKGELPSHQIIADGGNAGHSRDSIHRARRQLADRIQVRSFGMPRTTTWAPPRGIGATTQMTATTANDSEPFSHLVGAVI